MDQKINMEELKKQLKGEIMNEIKDDIKNEINKKTNGENMFFVILNGKIQKTENKKDFVSAKEILNYIRKTDNFYRSFL